MENASKAKLTGEAYGHENFSVERTQKRLKVVRQDRMNVEDINCFVEIGKIQYRVFNLSEFGLLVQMDANPSSDDVEAPLIVNDVEIGIIHMKLVRIDPIGVTPRLAAFEIVGEPLRVSRVTAVKEAKTIIGNHEAYQGKTKRIPDLFARKVYEVKDWLEDLQVRINALEKSQNHRDREFVSDFEDTIVQVVGDYFNHVMPIKNKDMRALIQDYNAEVIKNCYEFFREKLQQLIYQAPFSDRVYNKPLGYAGDYEMMNIIYRAQNEGETLFAKCLHHYWVKQPAAQAVRNRGDYLYSKLNEFLATNKSAQVLSVACGPAIEWQNLVSKSGLDFSNVEVDLLDQDENALKHAQRRLKEICGQAQYPPKIDYLHQAIKNVIARGIEKKYDVIYSAGLFDYFSDPVAQMAGARLFDALKPGGRLILGNFNVENPNSIVMDLALDWHLIYRSEADLVRLFGKYGGEIEVDSESLSVNLFCVIRKHA